MPKRTSALPLMLPDRDPKVPAYRWLYDALRSEILEGRLGPGARLPATRDLAEQYGLSRGTVVNAFEQLRSEGYAQSSVGSGTFVSRILPDDLLQVSRETRSKLPAPRRQPRTLSNYGLRVKPFPNYEIRPSRAFRANLPAVDLFPTTLWAQITARRLRRVSASLLLGCDPMGYSPLRDAVAAYLNTSRGVKCVSAQVAIVSGVQEALDLTARLSLNSGDRVCMENPGYPGALRVFEALGAKIVPVPVDAEGMHTPKTRTARLAYVTPGHQFPTGVTMSLPRRLELLEWAQRYAVLIFEDDYDSEFRYSGRPVPALQGLDRNGLVLFAGTFSKVMFPSLRLGYLVLPPDLVDSFAAAKSLTSRHASLLDQAVLCDFIAEGHFGRHLRRMREVYAERSAALVKGARQHLLGLLRLPDIEAGLQTAGWLTDSRDAESIATACAARNVEVTPLSRFTCGHSAREGLQLGFAAVDTTEIRRGVQQLALTLESTRV